MQHQTFLLPESFSPFPKAEQRERWSEITEQSAAKWTHFAQAYVDYHWPALRADRYAAYQREGDLLTYLNLFFERRSALGSLVVAELIEGKGRYLDDILNGIYCICEETTWVVPHHNRYIKHYPPESIPDAADHEVELASAETGALLALIHYLLAEPLDRTSKRIRERIKKEVRTRLIEPYLARDDYWWMGFSDAKHINNWNPWCNGNMLICFLFMENDEAMRTAGIHKVMRSLDEYIRRYPEDGCCDEGPMYWESSGGGLFRCLDMLQMASDGEIDKFSDPHVKEIGRYIYRVHIHDDYFVDFADGDARVSVGASAFGYGLRIGDEHLIRLGASTRGMEPEVYNWFSLYKVLSDLFEERLKQEHATGAPYIRESWMAEKQVMTAREHAGSEKGLFLAAKGGDNDESHNHNDVGNFIVYADGYPVLIDLGTEYYRAQTFSPQRYELWYLQSQYHNLPTVNGVLQHQGERFRTGNTECTLDEAGVTLSMELASAYPIEAGIDSWQRKCSLTRGNKAEVRITDEFTLHEPAEDLFFSLITPCKPQIDDIEPGTIWLDYTQGRRVKIHFSAAYLACRAEHIVLQDARLQSNWGQAVYRIILTETSPVQRGTRELSVTIEEDG